MRPSLAPLASGLVFLALALAALGQSPRPNILFVFTDDHATQAISAYGSRVIETPSIDRIAREGMLFERCCVTNAICAPSRAVILTGLHSHKNGVITNAERFDGSQTTLPKLLQRVGYQTAIFGKWHLKSDPTGFDAWEVLLGQGPYYNPKFDTPDGLVQHEGYTTDIITDRTLDWLENRRDPERPFLLMCQHKAPHRHWMPGPDHLSTYRDETIPEPPTLFDDYAGRGRAAREQEMTIARHLTPHDLKLARQGGLTDAQRAVWDAAYDPENAAFEAAGLEGDELVRWKYQRYVKDYLRCVRSFDDNLGRILTWLDESGLAENTVVVYSSDQGWFLGEHGWYDKRWMYEESLIMPFVVRWPGVTTAGSRRRELVSNLDFAPTFLEMAGAAVPRSMQGRSVAPILRGEKPLDWRQSVYYHYYEYPGAHSVRRHYGVRTDRYKLIRFYGIDEWELYDLARDPDELTSVHDDPAYAPIRRTLERELVRLRALYEVPEDERPLPEETRTPDTGPRRR